MLYVLDFVVHWKISWWRFMRTMNIKHTMTHNIGYRLRAVSLFLENPWWATQNKLACERDCDSDETGGARVAWTSEDETRRATCGSLIRMWRSHAHDHSLGCCAFLCVLPNGFSSKTVTLPTSAGGDNKQSIIIVKVITILVKFSVFPTWRAYFRK